MPDRAGLILKKIKGGMCMGSVFGTVIVGVILLAVVGAVVWKMISDRRKGKGGCSCGCENCNKCK